MPTLFKRSNGVYYISFEEEGKRRWKSTGQKHKTSALKELVSFKKIPASPQPNVTLQAFITDFLQFGEVSFSPGTTTVYKTTFRHFFSFVGDKLLASITAKDVDLYRTSRMKKVSPVTVNIELRMLRAAFYIAVRWNLLTENPFRRFSPARVPEQQPAYFSKEDFQRLLFEVREQWLKELILVAVLTGLRRGEILSLTWKNVDFDRRLLYIQSSESFRTKGGRRRAVPMNEIVFQLLWNKSERCLSEYVFIFKRRRVQESLVTHKFKKYVRKAGLNPKLHFHSLRHTFATWLVQEGISIYEVQKLLGHSNISVTQIYSHLAASELHSAVNKISVSCN